jgi:hypothetical protein
MDVYLAAFHYGDGRHPTYLLMACDDWNEMKERAQQLGFVLHNGDRTRALVYAEEEDRAFALQHPGKMFTSNCIGPQGEAHWVPATREEIEAGMNFHVELGSNPPSGRPRKPRNRRRK